MQSSREVGTTTGVRRQSNRTYRKETERGMVKIGKEDI